MCLCCKSCVSNFLNSSRSSQANSLVLFAFFYFIIIGLIFFFLPVLNVSTSQCDAIIIINAVIDIINAVYLYYIFWLLKQSLITNVGEDDYNTSLSMKIGHLIRTNHIVFSHPVLSVIAFIWICVSMKIADSFVVETSLVVQFVLNLLGFILFSLLLYIIPCICSRKHCKNTNSIVINKDRNSSVNELFNNSESSFGLYTSVPRMNPVEGIKIVQQPVTYFITPEQQQQQHIYIAPISTPNATISPTENREDEKPELPSSKDKVLIKSVVESGDKNIVNNNINNNNEEIIILPNNPPVKSDYIISQMVNNKNNIAPLPDINTIQYDDDDDEENPLNNSTQRPLSTIIEVNEESNNSTPHYNQQQPVSIQFVNETQTLFARAQAGGNDNDTESTIHIPQPPRQMFNNQQPQQLQFKSQSETELVPNQSFNKYMDLSSSSFSYSHYRNNTMKRSTGTNVGLFAMPSESTLLSNTSLLRNSSMDSLSSDASFVFNPSLIKPSSYPIQDNNSQHSNNSNPSFSIDIAPCGSNSCLYENIEEENELQYTLPPVNTYTSDFVTPGGYIEELPVDPQTIHFNMDDIDPVARDRILRGFEERKKRDECKKEDDIK